MLLCPWDSPGKNTVQGFHFLLQGIILTLGLYPASLVSPASARRFFPTGTTGGNNRSKEWKEKKSEEVIWVSFTSQKFLPPLAEPVHLLKSIWVLCLLKPRLSYSSSSLSAERTRKKREILDKEAKRENHRKLGAEFSSIQSLSHVQLFATPWTAVCQASLSITNSWSLLKLMSIEYVMPSNHLILCHLLFLLLSIFPATGSFPMSQFFASGGQSIRASASASVLPINIQD